MNDAPARRAGTPDHDAAPAYRERLLPGPGAWVLAIGLGVAFTLALLPALPLAAPGIGVLVAVTTVALLVATAPVIEVAGSELRAGQARIDTSFLGDVTPVFSAEQMRVELGPELDARAYVVLRSWARTGLRVEVVDPADPTPYWLVSTRRPDDLAAALEQARG